MWTLCNCKRGRGGGQGERGLGMKTQIKVVFSIENLQILIFWLGVMGKEGGQNLHHLSTLLFLKMCQNL